MKISIKWLLKFIDLGELARDTQKLSDLITNGGLEVEGVTNQSEQFKNVVVGQIKTRDKHPNADSLTLCMVDTGQGSPARIVCGAKNHKAGDKVVVALPGAVLPGDFAIKVSKIRGEESQGMLCSEKELGLKAEAEGIMILPENAPVGESFAKYAKCDDILLDIKVTPNRSDCLSHFGLARELSVLMGNKILEHPAILLTEGRESTRKLVKVTVEDSERCPRYAGRVVKNVAVGESPEWMKRALESVGLRSINNVVDVSNYVMCELGQPLHTFDLAKISDNVITVRTAKAGESFKALNDAVLTLDGTELMICDGKGPVALAGVMGGKDSGVSDATKDVFVESAYFQPSAVRRSSRRHGLDSDSSYRFSRGIDQDSVVLALNRACQLLAEVSGGTICTEGYDIYPRPLVRPRIEFDLKFISARLGIPVESAESKRLFERLGCEVSGGEPKLLVNPPTYRVDLKCGEDLGEEVLRLKGFGLVPETLPDLEVEPTGDDKKYVLGDRTENGLRRYGLNQAVNLSFTSSAYLSQFLTPVRGDAREMGLDYSALTVQIQNPLNIELGVLRTSILPSLVKNAAHNIRHGRAHGGLFEIAPTFAVKESADLKEKRPFTEEQRLGLLIWGTHPENWLKLTNAPIFFELKAVVEAWLTDWQFKSFKFEALKSAPGFLHPGQSARVFVEGKAVGVIGVLHPGLSDQLEIKVPVSVCELNLDSLFTGQPRLSKAKPLPKFPTVERDVAFLADETLPSGDIKAELLKAGGELVKACEVFDLYQGEKLPKDKKSLALRLTYQDANKTLSDDEVNALHQKTIQSVSQKLGLTLR